MAEYSVRSFGAFIADKKKTIEKHLREFHPTVVISRPEGIYVFADKIAKVHTTIVLAGAGTAFSQVANWFRDQISQLVLQWSGRDPKASVEADLLSPVFYPNNEAKPNIILADGVIVEAAATRANDYIARVNFSGKITKLDLGRPVVVSYKHREENPDASDDEHTPESLELAKAEAKEAYAKSLAEEFGNFGVDLHDFEEEHRQEALLSALKEKYPGQKCLLKRENIKKGKYPWVYEAL